MADEHRTLDKEEGKGGNMYPMMYPDLHAHSGGHMDAEEKNNQQSPPSNRNSGVPTTTTTSNSNSNANSNAMNPATEHSPIMSNAKPYVDQ